MAAEPLLGTVDENGFVWTVPRQIFVKLFVATGDPRSAARDSKLPADDDPEALLEETSVQEAIRTLHAEVLRRVHETEDTIIARYSNIAESSVFDYIDAGSTDANNNIVLANVRPKDWRRMPRHMQQRVKKFKISENQHAINFEIECHDPMKANDALARILGLGGDDGGNNPKDVADAIAAFLSEASQLDDHYIDPDTVAPEGTEPGPGGVAEVGPEGS